MDNYIMLNGEKIELTDFQSGMLQMMIGDKKLGNRDIFDRVSWFQELQNSFGGE